MHLRQLGHVDYKAIGEQVEDDSKEKNKKILNECIFEIRIFNILHQ